MVWRWTQDELSRRLEKWAIDPNISDLIVRNGAADGQSGIAECLRSGGRSPKFHSCGAATWRVVLGDRQGRGADGGTARRAPASSQYAQHHADRGRCLIPRTLPAHLF